MTKYLEDKRASHILIIVCFMTYTIIGFTRNTYSAAIAGIINEGYFSKADAGIIAASFNITYCVSQIVGSYYVDKISPFKIILLGIIVTIFANLTMSMSPTYWVIFISQSICGIAQFGIWPALLRILSEYVNEDQRNAWAYILPLGTSLGFVLSYLGAAIISEWRGLFVLSYIAMTCATIVFIITTIYAQKKAVIRVSQPKIFENAEKTDNTESIGVFKLLTASGALILVIPIFSIGIISGGINSWMPTMIMESYNVSPAISSVMTMVSTSANLIAVFWVIILYPRLFKLQTTATGMLFLFMVPFLSGSVFIGKIPMIFVIIFIATVNTFKGAINQFNTVEIPRAYAKYNKSGMIAGLINAVVILATVISSWFWGWMAERYNWDLIVALWAIMSFISAVFCFMTTPLWKKFVKK